MRLKDACFELSKQKLRGFACSKRTHDLLDPCKNRFKLLIPYSTYQTHIVMRGFHLLAQLECLIRPSPIQSLQALITQVFPPPRDLWPQL